MLSIHGVAVGIPTQATSERQSPHFTNWAKGELNVEPSSGAMIFTAEKCNLGPKVLGCLRGCEMESHSSGTKRVYICFTDSPMHNPLRLTFEDLQSQELVQQFEALAAAAAERHRQKAATHLPPQPDQHMPQEFAGRSAGTMVPMVYAGVSIYGRSPFNSRDDIFLGDGYIHLMDAQSARTYEVHVYETTGVDLLLSRTLTAKTRFQLLEPPTPASSGPVAMVQIRWDSQPNDEHVLAFDQKSIAHAFARDLHLRLQVLKLGRSASSHASRADTYEEQLWRAYESGVIPTVRRWLPWVCMLALLLLLVNIVSLIYDDPDQGLAAPLGQTLHTSRQLALAGWAGLEDVSSRACELATSSVSSNAVERCASFSEAWEIRSCVEALTSSHSWQ